MLLQLHVVHDYTGVVTEMGKQQSAKEGWQLHCSQLRTSPIHPMATAGDREGWGHQTRAWRAAPESRVTD